MKAVVAAFNQEKALVGAFSVITNLRMELFEALLPTVHRQAPIIRRDISPLHAVSCHTEADNVWQLAAAWPLAPVMFVSECDEEFLQGANRFHRYLYKCCLVKQCIAHNHTNIHF